MLVYYELGNGNINDGSVNCAVIVSRQADEKTGGIYTTATSSEEDISLENNGNSLQKNSMFSMHFYKLHCI